jgi:hypothetical protein
MKEAAEGLEVSDLRAEGSQTLDAETPGGRGSPSGASRKGGGEMGPWDPGYAEGAETSREELREPPDVRKGVGG